LYLKLRNFVAKTTTVCCSKNLNDDGNLDLLQTILGNTNSEFRNSANTESNNEYENKSNILQMSWGSSASIVPDYGLDDWR
jgi:hypothetical protein